VRILVDANLSPRVAERLAKAGYEASHVGDHDLLAASDEAIAAFAVGSGMIIVSADSDFATMLALSGHLSPSLILLRSGDALSPSEQATLIEANLPAVVEALAQGAVVSLSRRHLRVRRLPLR
jgi:predicted nuclease of predicted toxin-antitoxin system